MLASDRADSKPREMFACQSGWQPALRGGGASRPPRAARPRPRCRCVRWPSPSPQGGGRCGVAAVGGPEPKLNHLRRCPSGANRREMPKTALHMAAQSGTVQSVVNLLNGGAQVTCWDKVRPPPPRRPAATNPKPQTRSRTNDILGAGRMDTPAPRVPLQPRRHRQGAHQ